MPASPEESRRGQPAEGDVMESFVLNDLIEYSAERRVRKPLLKVPNLVSEIVCYEPGQTTPTHHHPVQDEIWLVLEGSGEIWVGEERMTVGPTSMIFIPAGQRHGLAATPDSRLVLLFIKGPGISEAPSVAAGSSETGSVSLPAESKLQLVVADVQAEARDVLLVELRARDGAELPAFEPGAHVAVVLPNGLVRQYSLTNDWRERDRYVLAIGRSSQSKGGSLFVHRALRRGMMLPTSAPRNGFALDASAGRFLFLAGGIGITPIVAMIRWCQANGRPWRLAYAVRSAQRAAFLETLEAFGGSIHLHADDRMSGVFDPGPWLSDAPDGEHVYCCGPGPMMAAVKAAAAHRPLETVHFEYFTAPPDGATALPKRPFTIELRRSGRSFVVPADSSILETLEHNGMKIVSYCREGTCRTCETTVLEGEIEHRDCTLSQQERDTGNTMMICVSRAKSERLVLDR